MFDFAMYLLSGGALLALSLLGLAVLLTPLYLALLWRDGVHAPSKADLADIDRLLTGH